MSTQAENPVVAPAQGDAAEPATEASVATPAGEESTAVKETTAVEQADTAAGEDATSAGPADATAAQPPTTEAAETAEPEEENPTKVTGAEQSSEAEGKTDPAEPVTPVAMPDESAASYPQDNSGSSAENEEMVIGPDGDLVSPDAPQASASLYIGDLHPDVTQQDLYELFSQVGQISSSRICRHNETRKSRGYGYVNFQSVLDAERALDTMNYHSSAITRDRPLRIMWRHRDPSLRKYGQGNLFIKNLDKSMDIKTLNDVFSPYGHIMSCKVQTDENGVSQGFGFVHFEKKESADRAIEEVNGMKINGKPVYVGPFMSKKDREASGQAHKTFTNVYIKYLDESVCSKEKVEELFSKFGEITSTYVPNGENGTPKGVAFVNFKDPSGAEQAVKEMNEVEIAGKKLYVSRAQRKPERDAVLRQRYESLKLERFKKLQGVNLYVKNLSEDIDDENLRGIFAPYGEITSCKIMRDDRNNSKGFGFVCYANQADANKAVSELNGQMIGGKPIYVALAQRKEFRKAQLERMRAANAMTPMYPPAGAPLFYQNAGVAQLNPAAMAAVAAGRGVPQPYISQYMLGRGAPVPGGVVPAGRGFPPQAVPTLPGAYDATGVGATPQRTRSGRSRPGGPGSGRGGPQQGGRGRGGSHPTGSQQQIRYTATARNAQTPNAAQPMAAAPAPATVPAPETVAAMPGANGQTPLTIEMLANASPAEQKTIVGERLYPLIYEREPQLAAKLTGMMIGLDISEILHLLESPAALEENIKEALEVLQEHNDAAS
mmetsp:Transcript_32226/g.126025  ORF Transcript_32226/g.126025 Transcript_32226/m.126025 type:complete len:776 (-) Transcript_32226:19-2346(-)|eukprot:CAMPEP_0113965754 /NCGR_PEP_ID=MMETSP0011_2-20120614/7930_1 /TAXON_ID=101924 /ORGANISM="Rhodosorus marinus" /LENGTH=775 /DNA_ID=CAMNT_0000978321 /DNA_START=299 /DNA_END=2626 /DNA_ORIENTATION=- /assembly_acc=CAM_ASM_000156